MENDKFRVEEDSMGKVKVPQYAYYGAGTVRAFENFNVSKYKIPLNFIYALTLVKKNAVISNFQLGLVDETVKNSVVKACDEVLNGNFDNQFIVNVFQTGSGTSTNMNVNEVIANRANEILGHPIGSYKVVHPNDHVNLGQSSNDTIPTSLNIFSYLNIYENLLPACEKFIAVTSKKEQQFENIIKIGRTHLQDAVPITLGNEFSAFKESGKNWVVLLNEAINHLTYLPLGGTATGSGINTHHNFPKLTIEQLSSFLNVDFKETNNHYKGNSQIEEIVNLSGVLKVIATSLMKIANDIRLLSSGPRCGIGEIILPETQPGSSIMPGKVNPVIAESICQICAEIIGNDTTISTCSLSGNLQLNTMLPLVIFKINESIELLANGLNNFCEKCIKGIKANKEICENNVNKSIALATPLAQEIGYLKASKIAKTAYLENKTVLEIAKKEKVLDNEKLEKILNPKNML